MPEIKKQNLSELDGINKHHKKVCCPKCGSEKLNITTESMLSGGNYSRLRNENRNFWICNDCGEKFRNIQSLEEEIAANLKSSKTARTMSVVFLIVFIVLIVVTAINPFLFWVFLAYIAGIGITSIICFAYSFKFKKKVKELEEEKLYLIENCFD